MKIKTGIIVIGIILFTQPIDAAKHSITKFLGEKLFTDINLSLNRNQSCESCHSTDRLKVPTENASGNITMKKQPSPGFVDPVNVIDETGASNGSVNRKFGGLNAPSVGYAAFSPAFHWDGELFIGGQFWNGRARDLVEQAKGPFLNPVEMAMPTQWSVIERLQQNRKYQTLFSRAYGIKLNDIREGDPEVEEAFNAIADAISAFERSSKFNRFDSKFDFEGAGITSYNASEQNGADLFDGDAQCGLCHTTEGIDGEGSPALLTDFSYDNLGTPANPQIPGSPAADPGLSGNPNLDAARGEPSAIEETEGRHKVMSLRNIALTAPYMHNGVFKSLEEVVHFYNTRDLLAACSNPADATNPGFGVTCWPEGEFHDTRNTAELGSLGLTLEEEADIVAYLKTFTDNYPLWGNSNGLRDHNVRKWARSPYHRYPVPDHSK